MRGQSGQRRSYNIRDGMQLPSGPEDTGISRPGDCVFG
jgi:hypothetical protein